MKPLKIVADQLRLWASEAVIFSRQLKTVLIVALFTVIFTACSFKTLYNNLDSLIPGYVEDMVSLDDVVEDTFENRTQALLNWHRNSQLRQYAEWMRSVQQDIDPQLNEQKVLQRMNEVEQFWRIISAKVNDEMAHLLLLLNTEQQQELFSNLAESNEDFREDYIDIDEKDRRDDYYENLYEVYENWIGGLSDEQEDLIKQAAQALLSTAELRLQRRLNWQSGIKEILSSSDSRQQKNQRLRSFFVGFENFTDKTMQEKSDVNRTIIARLTVAIAHKMDKEQKTFFISRTDEYIRVFTELAENR